MCTLHSILLSHGEYLRASHLTLMTVGIRIWLGVCVLLGVGGEEVSCAFSVV